MNGTDRSGEAAPGGFAGARRWRVAAAALLSAGAGAAGAQDRDRHVGYYYPEPTVKETFEAGATSMADASRLRRIGFVTIIANKAVAAAYPPPYLMFVKGAEAEKLIIVGMSDYVANVYQARALLAQLTAQSRTTEVFKEVDTDQRLTFLDLLKMLGFDQVTVTDGKAFTIQITIK